MGLFFQKSVILGVLCCGGWAGTLMAKDPVHLGTFGQWKAFEIQEKKGPVCFMTASPITQAGAYKKRGSVHMMITHRPHDKSYNVVSFHAGYPFPEGGEITLEITLKKGLETFSLFTKNQTAWAADSATDRAITHHLTRLGEKCVARGISAKGTKTTDTFSLSGSVAAYRAITNACRVLRKQSVLSD